MAQVTRWIGLIVLLLSAGCVANAQVEPALPAPTRVAPPSVGEPTLASTPTPALVASTPTASPMAKPASLRRATLRVGGIT